MCEASHIAFQYRRSGRSHAYIGDWHTHPDAICGGLSGTDRRVIRRLIKLAKPALSVHCWLCTSARQHIGGGNLEGHVETELAWRPHLSFDSGNRHAWVNIDGGPTWRRASSRQFGTRIAFSLWKANVCKFVVEITTPERSRSSGWYEAPRMQRETVGDRTRRRWLGRGSRGQDAAGARAKQLLWGSEWPHVAAAHAYAPSYAQTLGWLEELVPDEDARGRILGETPAALYRFR